MTEEDLKSITESIKEKLGEENTALIADDLGILMTKNTEVQTNLSDKINEISKLKDTNEKLVLANGRLLQQVPIKIDNKESNENSSKAEEYFDYHSIFDEKGNIKTN